MATDLLDNGDAAVLVLLGAQGRLDAERLVLPGGGAADVFVDDDGDTLVQVGAGAVASEQLVRAVLRHPDLTVYGDVLDLVVATTTSSWDRYVLSADMTHRLLFTRQWADREEAGGPVAALVEAAPGRAETDGHDAALVGRLRTAVKLLAADDAAPSKLHVLGVLTRRSDDPSSLSGVPAERMTTTDHRDEALAETDVIVPAWGVLPEDAAWAVEAVVDEVRQRHEAGAKVLVPAADGEPSTVGDPAQPARLTGQGGELVEAPSEWLWGGQLG